MMKRMKTRVSAAAVVVAITAYGPDAGSDKAAKEEEHIEQIVEQAGGGDINTDQCGSKFVLKAPPGEMKTAELPEH